MYLTEEVQVMAQRVLTERGYPVQASNSSSSGSAASMAEMTATDRRTWSSTSSNRSLSMHSTSSSTMYSRGEQPCETNTEAFEADPASFSLTNLKSAYLQAAANTPSIGSGNSTSSSSGSGYGYSSQAVPWPPVAAAGSAHAAGGVSAAVAALRSNFLQAFKEDEKRLKEAAAEAAAAAAAEAAAETAAGGISVSSLRSGWLETQRQQAERAAAEAAVAASLTSGKSRPTPVRASSPGMWGAGAVGNEQQSGPTPSKALKRFSCAGTAAHAGSSPPAITAAAAAATGQRVLDKTHEVAQMAEKLLRTARVSNSGPGCGGLMPATSGGFGATATALGSGAGAEPGVPVAAPLAYGDAMPIDLDM